VSLFRQCLGRKEESGGWQIGFNLVVRLPCVATYTKQSAQKTNKTRPDPFGIRAAF